MSDPTVRTAPRTARGFTLLEVVIALAIAGALLAIAFGGLRVALAAWNRGEARAEVHQHARALAALVARSIVSAYPYHIAGADAPEPVLQFEGRADRLSFVTLAAPLPLAPAIAFTAVRLELDNGAEPGLTIRERALPNREVFTEAITVFTDPAVTALTFRYLSPDGDWRDAWDGASEEVLPAAVQVTIETTLEGRPATIPITVALRTTGER